MKDLIMRLWRDEDGAEMVEWIVVVALLVAVAVAVYQLVLQDALNGGIQNIAEQIPGGS